MVKVIVICGPTATGKTKLALDLGRYFPLEVISADSMQIYRYMDIGTAKPTPEEMSRIRHHLVSIKDPDEPWSVEEFKERASQAIEEICGRGNIPFIVGGTGLYIRALLSDYPLTDAPPDPEFRGAMKALAEREGKQAVHALLKDKDPEAWKTLHPNDLKRVIRALEYHRATGRPISARRLESPASPYDPLKLAIRWDRQDLGKRIDNRVEDQFREGFVEEVLRLRRLGFRSDLPSMQGLGYKEIGYYLDGLLSLDETKALIKRNTRRLAKRQFTWFSREEGITWMEASQDRDWDDLLREAAYRVHSHISGRG
ncbi:MAG TPA: tRNA (adenosine(37)-N6)-dimethylallyltransferase MiaA [Firmicutes bacterium]|nr:tRNA (adenosine(37)-N6)-dimethylallyltransferase MiaA [Candidatus Fermentithermobacillaceae bacterium]